MRLNLIRLFADTRRQTSDSTLELAVLGGVDERVDAAVGEHQYHGQVVEPALNGKLIGYKKYFSNIFSENHVKAYMAITNKGKNNSEKMSMRRLMVGKVVEPASEIYTVANEIEKEHDLIR